MSNIVQAVLPEIYMGLSSLLVHKLRTMLTMLGMIFGVGAVVAMLAITAGVEFACRCAIARQNVIDEILRCAY